jgi:hypothetical protein
VGETAPSGGAAVLAPHPISRTKISLRVAVALSPEGNVDQGLALCSPRRCSVGERPQQLSLGVGSQKKTDNHMCCREECYCNYYSVLLWCELLSIPIISQKQKPACGTRSYTNHKSQFHTQALQGPSAFLVSLLRSILRGTHPATEAAKLHSKCSKAKRSTNTNSHTIAADESPLTQALYIDPYMSDDMCTRPPALRLRRVRVRWDSLTVPG